MRHLISLAEMSDGALRDVISRGRQYSSSQVRAENQLCGRVVGIYFRTSSTRTRTAFSTGALRLGARIVSYGPRDLQENTGESIEDTARVLSLMLEAFVARTAGRPDELRALAAQNRMAVVNAMSADEHPTQALADLTTILCHFGVIDGVRVLYVGEGNNTAAALALGLARFPGTVLYLRTPPGYGLAPDKLACAAVHASRCGARVEERHDMDALPEKVDIVYTTRWETTGTTKPNKNWRVTFAPFSVDLPLIDRYPDAVFMHDLPAHRGEEVAGEVIDGASSIVFEQARNKLHSAMAVLEWCMCES